VVRLLNYSERSLAGRVGSVEMRFTNSWNLRSLELTAFIAVFEEI
jgi:hypothetical protein